MENGKPNIAPIGTLRTVMDLRDKVQLLLDITGASLVFLGIAYFFLEMRRLGPYGGPTVMLGLVPLFAGLAIVVSLVDAERNRTHVNTPRELLSKSAEMSFSGLEEIYSFYGNSTALGRSNDDSLFRLHSNGLGSYLSETYDLP